MKELVIALQGYLNLRPGEVLRVAVSLKLLLLVP